jgi:hemerythrin-like metal-binding domain
MTPMFVVWNENRSSGIPIIDEQHRSIIATMNSLFYFMRKDDGKRSIIPLVTILEQHINIHFMAEENLLRETQYEGLEEHTRYHADIAKRLRCLSAKLRHTGNAADLLAFLKDWWKDHIEVHDRAYTEHVVQFLRSKYDA